MIDRRNVADNNDNHRQHTQTRRETISEIEKNETKDGMDLSRIRRTIVSFIEIAYPATTTR